MNVLIRAVALGGVIMLAACASSEETSEVTSSIPATSVKAMPEVASTPPPEVKVPEIKAPAPEALIGFKAVQLSETFGKASLVRRDLGAEIWQYRARECVLFLFLYTNTANDASEVLRVRHIDVRGNQSPTDCVQTIVRERGSRNLG